MLLNGRSGVIVTYCVISKYQMKIINPGSHNQVLSFLRAVFSNMPPEILRDSHYVGFRKSSPPHRLPPSQLFAPWAPANASTSKYFIVHKLQLLQSAQYFNILRVIGSSNSTPWILHSSSAVIVTQCKPTTTWGILQVHADIDPHRMKDKFLIQRLAQKTRHIFRISLQLTLSSGTTRARNSPGLRLDGLGKIRESSRRSKTKSNLGLDTIDRPGLPSPPPCVSQCQSSSS